MTVAAKAVRDRSFEVGPPFVIEERECLRIVRDDYLPGGTKTRVARVLWANHDEVVFASPAEGCAQIALGHTARALRKTATIFVAKRRQRHPNTQAAEDAGARIEEVEHGRMSVVRRRALDHAEAVGGRFLPLGLDAPELRAGLTQVGLAAASALDRKPSEVWVCGGSGVLAISLRAAFPGIGIRVVQIGMELLPDLHEAEDVSILQAPEAFAEEARHPPPFPSCANYDAKVWQFIQVYAAKDALFWNVAA